MDVFFNTSPIIFLEKLDILDKLLPKLWDKIYIADAVIEEINDVRITNKPFFHKYTVKDKIALLAMPSMLHRGEIEAIIGAIETGTNYLIIDDLKGRKKAQSLGVKSLGTLGVILLSFRKGLLTMDDAIQCFYSLREHSFWIDNKLFNELIEKLKTY